MNDAHVSDAETADCYSQASQKNFYPPHVCSDGYRKSAYPDELTSRLSFAPADGPWSQPHPEHEEISSRDSLELRHFEPLWYK